MAFEGLAERLQATMQKLGKGKVTEADVKQMMRKSVSPFSMRIST